MTPAEQERAAVVAWLRDRARQSAEEAERLAWGNAGRGWLLMKAGEMSMAADAVERGDHRRGP